MQITVPLEFLDTLGITQPQKQITSDFSDYLLRMLKLFDGMEQPVWKRLLLNTCFDVADNPNAIQSNGVGVRWGVEKLQELMALPPNESMGAFQNIMENVAKLAVAQTLDLSLETSEIEIIDDTRFGYNPKIFDAIRQQHTFHAIQNGWSSTTNAAYAPTAADLFYDALEKSWTIENFDTAVDYYVDAFVQITDTDELSGLFQLRFCLDKMIDKLNTINPSQMMQPSGDLTEDGAIHLVQKLTNHPKMPKYACSLIATHLAPPNKVESSAFLYTLHQKYSEIQEFKKQLLVDRVQFWDRVRSNLDEKTPLFQKNNLVDVIVQNYPYPQTPLLHNEIFILSQSPYVLKQLFDAGVVATDKDQNANVMDADEHHHYLYSPNQQMTLKDRMIEFVSQNNTDSEDVHAAQDLLNIFQRTTLYKHIGAKQNVVKRKM